MQEFPEAVFYVRADTAGWYHPLTIDGYRYLSINAGGEKPLQPGRIRADLIGNTRQIPAFEESLNLFLVHRDQRMKGGRDGLCPRQ